MHRLNGFGRYCSVGMINSALHASVFLLLHSMFGLTQARSNLAGFLAAVTLSFYLNARYTFGSYRSWRRYWTYLTFMGLLSLSFGAIGDALNWPPALTLVTFSIFSLVIGFFFSRHMVFSGRLS